MEKESPIRIVYGFNNFQNGNALEVMCYLASHSVRFELCPGKKSEARLIIGDESFSYKDFKRKRSKIEKLILKEMSCDEEKD